MAKLIVRCNYLKNEPSRHRSNFIKYLGTREGVEINTKELPKAFWDDVDMHGKKSNYVDYLAGRPGAVRVDGQAHGLFTDAGVKVDLEDAMEEVACHQGTVWINVISLKREDAERLGYDEAEKWQALLRSHVADVAEAFQIKQNNLRWYAAFHNEGHHPHVHVVVFSKGKEGFLTKRAIEKLKSAYVGEIFRDEMAFLYDEKTKQRKNVKDVAGENLMEAMLGLANATEGHAEIGRRMNSLSKKLVKLKGKKSYGYLHRNLKNEVDEILHELEKVPKVRECYEKWMKWQRAIVGYYRDDNPPIPPLSENREFRSIKNAIIKASLSIYDRNETGKAIAPMGKTSDGFHQGKSDDASPQQIAILTARLFKYLEKLFMKKTSASRHGRKMIAESKLLAREAEKKEALGQKADDAESMEIGM